MEEGINNGKQSFWPQINGGLKSKTEVAVTNLKFLGFI